MQVRWLQHTIYILLFLFLSIMLPVCISQTPPPTPVSLPPAPPLKIHPALPVALLTFDDNTDLQKAQDDLSHLTDKITTTLKAKFSFCISDVEKDWNDTFGFASNTTFVTDCLIETQGDFSNRICTPDEIKFYFNLFSTSRQVSSFLEPNKNCNMTSWALGCNPGWACSLTVSENQTQLVSDADYKKRIPLRNSNCRRCCKGFFCPRGLTCMIPCPLGAYCPVAELNGMTGTCNPYGYQVPTGNGNSSACGAANMWADVGSTNTIFCPPGYYCPSTVEKLNCTNGYFCRLGSSSQTKCLFRSSCDPNSEKDNILFVGVLFMVAMSVLLLIFYNFSGIFLRIRERRKAKSREIAAERARETVQARQRWKTAKEIAKRNIAQISTQVSRTISHSRRISISHDEPWEEPGVLLSKPRELSDASATTTKKENVSDLYDNIEILKYIEDNTRNNKNEASKKKHHRHTRTQIFHNAYMEIEKEKAYQQENKNMIFSEVFSQATKERVMKRPLLEVAFKDLTLTLGKKKLLGSVMGKLVPGKVTAVMGPSGAGKTTFLNAVVGKIIAGCKVSGSVLVNGKVGNIRSYKKIIGFVPQDDIVHGNLTVEENLWFSARCRMSANMSEANKILVVERVIESLGLQGIRNSLVGTVEKRGISGGQRKRVNVGLEMVMEPSLLILDEPTSGLDSSSSQLLLRALRREALEGVNIAAVIHQPSYTLFRMFDDIILLAKGGFIVYHGSIGNVEGYFSMLGINVPDRVNPPDYFIDVLEGIIKVNSEIDIKHLPLQWILYNGYDVLKDMQGDLEELNGSNRSSRLSSGRSESLESSEGEGWDNVRYSRSEDQGHSKEPKDLTNRKTPGVLKQYKHYLGRVVKQRLRDAQCQAVDYIILCLAGTCLGIIARLDDKNFGIPGYIYTIIAISLLCKIAALKSFSQDQLQFWRERASGMSSLAYFLSKDTVDHFNNIVKPVVYLSMFYFFNNPRSSFLDNLAVMIALVYCVTGVGYTFAVCFKPASAQLWSALLPVVLTLLSTQSGIPPFLANLCYPKWALEAFVIANAKRYSGVWLITRCAVLLKSNYDINHWGLCLTVLFIYGLLFRIIAFICLVLLQKK